jgi:hypothetical protein
MTVPPERGFAFARPSPCLFAVLHDAVRSGTGSSPTARWARDGHLVPPFVLIALGIAILYEGGTFELLMR